MGDKHFFDIPIYLCSPQEYQKRREQQKSKDEQYYFDIYKKQGFEAKPEHVAKIVEDSLERNWRPWSYNQIIGYIRLFTFFDQIRGELWFAKKERHTLNAKNNVISYVGKAFQTQNFSKLTNVEIYNKVFGALKSYQKESPQLKKRFLDTENFSNAGPLIDYKALLGL